MRLKVKVHLRQHAVWGAGHILVRCIVCCVWKQYGWQRLLLRSTNVCEYHPTVRQPLDDVTYYQIALTLRRLTTSLSLSGQTTASVDIIRLLNECLKENPTAQRTADKIGSVDCFTASYRLARWLLHSCVCVCHSGEAAILRRLTGERDTDARMSCLRKLLISSSHSKLVALAGKMRLIPIIGICLTFPTRIIATIDMIQLTFILTSSCHTHKFVRHVLQLCSPKFRLIFL